ncbi:MAG: hypothetical protein WCK29_02910 [archaeon]
MQNLRRLTNFDISAVIAPHYDWRASARYKSLGRFKEELTKNHFFIHYTEKAWMEANKSKSLMTVRLCRKEDMRDPHEVYESQLPIDFPIDDKFHYRIIGLTLVNSRIKINLHEYPSREESLRFEGERVAIDQYQKTTNGRKFGIGGEVFGRKDSKTIETALNALRTLNIFHSGIVCDSPRFPSELILDNKDNED